MKGRIIENEQNTGTNPRYIIFRRLFYTTLSLSIPLPGLRLRIHVFWMVKHEEETAAKSQ